MRLCTLASSGEKLWREMLKLTGQAAWIITVTLCLNFVRIESSSPSDGRLRSLARTRILLSFLGEISSWRDSKES